MKLFDTVNTETALFVTSNTAEQVCDIALQDPRVREATYRRRFRRGEMLGYCVTLKFSDGTTSEMSEHHVEALLVR